MKTLADGEALADMSPDSTARHGPSDDRPVGAALWALWCFGGFSYAAIVLGFTPLTDRFDDIKVTMQFVLMPILAVLLAIVLLQRRSRPIPRWVGLSLLAYVLLGLASTLVADFRWRAWQEWGFELCLIVAFLIVAFTATTQRRFKNLCRFFFIVACATIVVGLFHYFGGVRWLLRTCFPDGQPTGAPSAFYALLATLNENPAMISTILNRDFYPSYLIMIVPLVAAFFLESRTPYGRAFYGIAGFFFCLCSVLAASNDSNLALTVMFVMMLALLIHGRLWVEMPRRLLILWVAGGFVVLLTTIFFLRSYIYAIPSDLQVAIQSRSIIWSGAWKIFCDPEQPTAIFVRRLLAGSGPGGFMPLFPIYRSPDYFLWQVSQATLYPHSQPLGLLSERGLLGTLAFTSFLGGICWLLAREIRRRHNHPVRLSQIALLTALVGVTIQNLTSPSIRWTVCGLTYWFLLGLAVAAIRLSIEADAPDRVEKKWPLPRGLYRPAVIVFLIGAIVFGGFAIPYGIRLFGAAIYNKRGWISMNDLTTKLIPQMYALEPGETRERVRRKALEFAQNAERDYKVALEFDPTYLTSLYFLGYTASRHTVLTDVPEEKERTRREALDAYDRLAEYAPRYAAIDMGYAMIHQLAYIESADKQSDRARNHRDTAVRHLEKLARATNALATHWTLAGVYEEMGDGERARTVYKRILDLAPDRIRGRSDRDIERAALERLMEHAKETGNREEVIALSRRRLKDDPWDAATLADMAENLRRLGRDGELLEVCREWIERNPLDPLPRHIAVVTLIDHDEVPRALQQVMALLEIQQRRRRTVSGPWALPTSDQLRTLRDPPQEVLWLWAGRLIERIGGTTAALSCYENSMSFAPFSDAAKQSRKAHEDLANRLKAAPKPSEGTVGGNTKR